MEVIVLKIAYLNVRVILTEYITSCGSYTTVSLQVTAGSFDKRLVHLIRFAFFENDKTAFVEDFSLKNFESKGRFLNNKVC